MPEPATRTDPLALEAIALRYAAGTLPSAEAAAFEAQLGRDDAAREALAEAVRLSAAALGQEPPRPDSTFRLMIRERIRSATPGWLARRAYRGHPYVWGGFGAGLVAAATVLALQLSDSPHSVPGPASAATAGERAVAPAPRELSPAPVAVNANEPPTTEHAAAPPDDDMLRAAEIWAELSTPQHVEKAHDDEQKLHRHLKTLQHRHALDSHEP